MNVKDFENRFMQLISGQMPVPQSLFRQFLGWLQEKLGTEVSTIGAKADAALPASAIVFDTDTLKITVGGHTYAVSATEVEESGDE